MKFYPVYPAKHLVLFTLLFTITIGFAGCQSGNNAGDSDTGQKWVSTWSTAPQLVEPRNMPPDPGLSNNSLRQLLRVSIGGEYLRMRFSNEYSSNPTTLKAVQLAVARGGDSIDRTTVVELLFGGKPGVTMAPGKAVTSDPVSFPLSPRTDLSVTILYGETSPDVTGHPGSRTTSFLLEGNHLSDADFVDASRTDHWYTISGIEVKAPESAAAVAILGNSITDGRGSGTNRQNRWPDVLSERLLAHPGTEHVAVLNQGIGGNCILRDCLGPSALERFERDIIEQAGVKWLIILEGINDLGQTPGKEEALRVARELIAAYDRMIDSAHQHQIKVYGATILPFKRSFYYKDFRETARDTVNAWIRTSGRFDAVIDFDEVMQSAGDPLTMRPDVHMGDFLHPNEEGYAMMGGSVDLHLFE